jgi:hypothetical protein
MLRQMHKLRQPGESVERHDSFRAQQPAKSAFGLWADVSHGENLGWRASTRKINGLFEHPQGVETAAVNQTSTRVTAAAAAGTGDPDPVGFLRAAIPDEQHG